MLYLIGLGLNDEGDLPMKAVDELRSCDVIFWERYTGKWTGDMGVIEAAVGKTIRELSRDELEGTLVVDAAKAQRVALLVPGDPLAATTHIELVIAARERGIDVRVIHASSIFTAVAETGLQLYKFGKTTTLVFPQARFFPESPYMVIEENQRAGLHTLVLLDVKDRCMTVREGLECLRALEERIGNGVIRSDMQLLACCRLGSADRVIKSAPFRDMLAHAPAETPAVLVIPGALHFKEEEAIRLWM